MTRWLSGLVVLSWLAGCAALSYQEPLQGARARVRFVTDATGVTVLRAYSDTGCTQNEAEWMRLRHGPLATSRLKTLGMPLWNHHENAAKEVYVDASQRMNGMFFGHQAIGIGVIHQCGVPFSFPFEANRDYEVKYHFVPRQCHVVISEIVPNGNAWAYKRLARFDNRTDQQTQGCYEQFKRLRWD